MGTSATGLRLELSTRDEDSVELRDALLSQAERFRPGCRRAAVVGLVKRHDSRVLPKLVDLLTQL
jgi:hypothetical protein